MCTCIHTRPCVCPVCKCESVRACTACTLQSRARVYVSVYMYKGYHLVYGIRYMYTLNTCVLVRVCTYTCTVCTDTETYTYTREAADVNASVRARTVYTVPVFFVKTIKEFFSSIILIRRSKRVCLSLMCDLPGMGVSTVPSSGTHTLRKPGWS